MASHEVVLRLPARFSQRILVDDNSARQLQAPTCEAKLKSSDEAWYVDHEGSRYELRARGQTPPGELGLELPRSALTKLPAIDVDDLRWVGTDRPADPSDVLDDLDARFVLQVATSGRGSRGLRIPQAGALHAILAHWSTGATEPATIVLPTGTGKTDTMVALTASERPMRVLVLVPSDRLRAQIAEWFENYGVLREIGALDDDVPGLVVGRIEHRFTSLRSMRSLVERCNVIVTTPDALQASTDGVVDGIVSRCSHLFVDEAHHVPAKTWRRVRNAFNGKPVVQFTATPYREDGQPLGGRIVYSFPLSRARELGYFEPIQYRSVVSLADPDRAVARAAVDQLRADREHGLDHLILARVNQIRRAEEVLPIYEELAPDFAPQLLHSRLSTTLRAAALDAVDKRESRIVICVDMLGEGVDLPELKIAALHDPHRSLGVALQFIGRFARTRDDLGAATAVVARPDPGYDEKLRALYAEDSQWDSVIEVLADQATEEAREIDDFERRFAQEADDPVSIHVLRPRMSTVVYETSCSDWHPERLIGHFPPERTIAPPSINKTDAVVWMVVEARSSVVWAQLESLKDIAHHLHVLHWDAESGLLYVNTSQLETLHEDLAKLVCGSDVRIISGTRPYRALGDLQRPTPTNVGVIDLRSSSRRFSMHVGADVYEGFPDVEQRSKANTNISVVAYDKGERVVRAAARKGRIWSQQGATSILDWVQWCRDIGSKLLDDSISLESILRNFVRPEPLKERPRLFPLAMDWPYLAYAEVSPSVKVNVDGQEGLLIDADLVLTDHADNGTLPFEIRVGDASALYEAWVDTEDEKLSHRAAQNEAMILRERSDPEPLSAYLNREGSTIWFEQEVVIDRSVLYRMERDQPAMDEAKLEALSWEGIDIRRESQGPERNPATVQARAARHLQSLEEWDLVIDDDGTGEVADLVGLKDLGDRVLVQLVHCKYSSNPEPGARVEDLYAVCGQAHRSAHNRQHIDKMMSNLVRRERNRLARNQSGLLVGEESRLLEFEDIVRQRRATLRVTIAQPGLSKNKAGPNHLNLLGATDVYVAEVAFGRFDVWCSP